jgi:hypothetical protein
MNTDNEAANEVSLLIARETAAAGKSFTKGKFMM